mgnify:CR=1 FL=1
MTCNLFRLAGVAAVLLAADERTPVPGFFDLPVTGGTATFETCCDCYG